MNSLRVDVLLGAAYDPDVRVRRGTQALAQAGYRVRILAWDRDARLPPRDVDGDVIVLRSLVRSQRGRGWRQFAYLARAMAGHLRAMRHDRPDVLHAVDLPVLFLALLFRSLVGRPRIVYDAFEIYAVMESEKYPRWLLWLFRIAERLLPRAADLVITPGRARQRYFEARGINSVVVGNWIDPPRTTPSRGDARRLLGIGPDAQVIVYAGGLDPSRDLVALVRHGRAHPHRVVLIAGRGVQEEWLRDQAEAANVRFLGWVSRPETVLASADVLYYALTPGHPYAQHAAPNNLYTAIAYAIPIAYRAGGELAELALSHHIGLPFTDDDSLASAIDRLLEPETNAAIREELRALQATYSWERARAALLTAYGRLGSTISKATPYGP